MAKVYIIGSGDLFNRLFLSAPFLFEVVDLGIVGAAVLYEDDLLIPFRQSF